MAKLNILGFSLDVETLMWAVTSHSAPSIVKGALLHFVEGKSAAEMFRFVKEYQGFSVWDLIGEEWQENLAIIHGKTGVLDKLTVEWAANALKKERPDLASLIINSKEVKAFIKKALRDLKKGADSFIAQ